MAVDATTPVGASSVTGAIRKAAQATGASFDYLLATAKVESDLNPNLTMRSSTATGLFQFIDQTWLATLKQAGPAFGYGDYASAITRTASGRYVVDNAGLRNQIMALRKDPTANALMGGAFTQQNAILLASRLGRAPTEGELYIGHFLGPSAAASAITLAGSNPTAPAADLFPAAAHANRSIFYDQRGNARSIASVCAELIRRYQSARTQATASIGAAPRPPAAIPDATAAAVPSLHAQSVQSVHLGNPDTQDLDRRRPAGPISSVNPAASAQVPSALAFAVDTDDPGSAPAADAPLAQGDGGMFHSLFQTGERREPISPAISQLWGVQGKPQQSSSAADVSAAQASGRAMFDLFRTHDK
jgi:hypothetical protein